MTTTQKAARRLISQR